MPSNKATFKTLKNNLVERDLYFNTISFLDANPEVFKETGSESIRSIESTNTISNRLIPRTPVLFLIIL
jgi:hypothetical protein